MKLKIYTDGGSRGNPGPSATGWLICDEKGDRITSGGTFLGESTNNDAEFHALLEALIKALEYDPEKIDCYLDSELLVKQLNGEYKVKAPHLAKVLVKIHEMIDFRDVNFYHIPREKNKYADAIVNKILDKYANKSL